MQNRHSQNPRKFNLSIKDRDVATFYLFLAIQECIDLAAHWVVDEGWGSPDSAGESFDILAERHVIDGELANQLRGAVGLRNRIVHGYAAVDHRRLHREAKEGIQSLRSFLATVLSSL